MKRLVLFIAALVTIFTVYFYSQHPLGAKVKIGTHLFKVEVAATNAEKEKGLGYRDSLPQDSGMLFPYDHKEQYMYWMRGMRFPLDFIWIDGNTVVDLTPNVPQPTNDTVRPALVGPRVAVDKVLEVNAGIIQKLDIKIGDTFEFID